MNGKLFVVLVLLAISVVIVGWMLFALPATADNVVLVPEEDAVSPEAWQADDGTACGGGEMVCASRVDEDVDAPNDADYIRSVFDPDQADLLTGCLPIRPDGSFAKAPCRNNFGTPMSTKTGHSHRRALSLQV